jgi:hypothetical protein
MALPVIATASCYDDMPFAQILFRFLWPFWLFQDASRGDRLTRAAAYRHNRNMRVYLPGYLLKWMLNSAFALAVTAGLESLAHQAAGPINVLMLIAAGTGIVFACALCVLLVIAYVYLYLGRHES